MGNTDDYGQGERTLSQAATLVSAAKVDFDRLSGTLEDNIAALRGKWAGAGGQAFFVLHQAWTEKQKVIVSALNEFETSLQTTERDNISTDDTQSSNYHRVSGRLDGVSRV